MSKSVVAYTDPASTEDFTALVSQLADAGAATTTPGAPPTPISVHRVDPAFYNQPSGHTTPVGAMAAVTPDPGTELHDFVTRYGLELIEWDAPDLRDKFYAHYLGLNDGRRLLVVLADQGPAVHLRYARALIAHQGVMPV